jgi:hypothetical protein
MAHTANTTNRTLAALDGLIDYVNGLQGIISGAIGHTISVSERSRGKWEQVAANRNTSHVPGK